MKVSFPIPPLTLFCGRVADPQPPKDYVSCVFKLTRSPLNIGHPALLEGGERSQASSSPYFHHSKVRHCHPATQEGECFSHGIAHSHFSPPSSLVPLGPCAFPLAPPSHQLSVSLFSLCLSLPYRPRKKKERQTPLGCDTPTTATIQSDGFTHSPLLPFFPPPLLIGPPLRFLTLQYP
jgi:hypothetical protein